MIQNEILKKVIIILTNTLISGFCGAMAAKAATLFITNPFWAYSAAGIGGYLGIGALNYVIDVMKRIKAPR